MKLLVALVGLVLSILSTSHAFVSGGMMARTAAAAPLGGSRRARGQLSMADVVVEFTKTGKTVNAVVGTPLAQFCAKNGIKVKYNCKQGDCATCSINIDGRNVKACQGRVPASRRIIKIKA